MSFLDKKGLIPSLPAMSRVILELGCGNTKKNPDAIGVDLLDFDCVDIVGDVFGALRAFPDASVDLVESEHFFEHIANVNDLITEISRVLKPSGTLRVVVPHFSNPYFYSDPTHRVFFGLYTFCYFATTMLFSRKVPLYGRVPELDLIDANLRFKSSRPFYVRHAIKRVIERVVNISSYTKEFYEENLCYLVPCYEVEYLLKKKSSSVHQNTV